MSERKMPAGATPGSTEKAVRAIFRRHFLKLTNALISRECLQVMEYELHTQIALFQFLTRESKRKTPSKKYRKLCRSLLTSSATQQLGILSSLTSDQLTTLDQVLGIIVAGMAGKPAIERLDPAAFLSLQKTIFVQPKKRGPKNRSKFDEAFLRHLKGEEITSIARGMDPQGFDEDPVNAIQKLSRAIERRKRQAFRL